MSVVGPERRLLRDSITSGIVKGFGCRPRDENAACTGGRRPKASKGGNRDGGPCATPLAATYVGLERSHNFEVTARMLLNGDLRFCTTCDFNELLVAKIAHSATVA